MSMVGLSRFLGSFFLRSLESTDTPPSPLFISPYRFWYQDDPIEWDFLRPHRLHEVHRCGGSGFELWFVLPSSNSSSTCLTTIRLNRSYCVTALRRFWCVLLPKHSPIDCEHRQRRCLLPTHRTDLIFMGRSRSRRPDGWLQHAHCK
jgi:hypothetical protein